MAIIDFLQNLGNALINMLNFIFGELASLPWWAIAGIVLLIVAAIIFIIELIKRFIEWAFTPIHKG